MNTESTCLESTTFFDYEQVNLQEIVAAFKNKGLSPKEKAIQIYLKVRDGWRYNPYRITFTKEAHKASVIASKEDGHCIDKAILLVTCMRALDIPARLRLAKVKNHIAVEKLVEKFGTNELTPHGMVEVFLNKKWLKVSPAFNAELCHKCKVAPLNFDGENDSVFQEYNADGKQFMEYLEDYGCFEDVPLNFIFQNLKEHYAHVVPYLERQTEMIIK